MSEGTLEQTTHDDVQQAVGRGAFIISVCVIISRITGFIRTWAMGFAMGTTLLSSSYQVACNLPNQLYELVMGGMLATAFLPVYVSLRRNEGEQRANTYASTVMGLVLILFGFVALLATICAPQVVFTQMFLNPSGDRELVTYFFRFFAIQLLFYGIAAVAGGLLNAQREYFWSSAAPIANNIVVIIAMFVYVFISPSNPELAKLCIAIGTPLGIFIQMGMQVMALAKHNIHLTPWHIDIHDPALRETLAIGVPTIIVTIASFVTVSVQNASAMHVSEAGSSVLFYARQWFTLPYAFLAVPLTTTLFTEISDLVAQHDRNATARTILNGITQILFFMIPFMFYLIVFAEPLVTLFCAGSFSVDSVALVSNYLRFMALSLPFYAVFLYMQKVFSSIRSMRVYALANVVASLVQVVLTFVLCLGIGSWHGWGLPGIALAQTAFFALGTLWCIHHLRVHGFIQHNLGEMRMSIARSTVLGFAGALVGFGALYLLATLMGGYSASILKALACVIPAGLFALLVTYGGALFFKIPEASLINQLVSRFLPKGHHD